MRFRGLKPLHKHLVQLQIPQCERFDEEISVSLFSVSYGANCFQHQNMAKANELLALSLIILRDFHRNIFTANARIVREEKKSYFLISKLYCKGVWEEY